MATMNISLPDQMKEWVDTRIGGGTYSSASDYMRDLVRKDQEHIAWLQREIDKGIASGISDKTPEEIFKHARQRAIAILRERLDGLPDDV
ncbi:MAG: type II toxin-antitoxin system ParD family antitoxin [Devosia sp.]|jgi:antitoxin ParD1/3/4|nr:type II toxin-antitoxin system ParD family antitoxin [Devosia sp.]